MPDSYIVAVFRAVAESGYTQWEEYYEMLPLPSDPTSSYAKYAVKVSNLSAGMMVGANKAPATMSVDSAGHYYIVNGPIIASTFAPGVSTQQIQGRHAFGLPLTGSPSVHLNLMLTPVDGGRRVQIASNTTLATGNVTVTGTDAGGSPLTENIALAGLVIVTGAQYFATITEVDIPGVGGLPGSCFVSVMLENLTTGGVFPPFDLHDVAEHIDGGWFSTIQTGLVGWRHEYVTAITPGIYEDLHFAGDSLFSYAWPLKKNINGMIGYDYTGQYVTFDWELYTISIDIHDVVTYTDTGLGAKSCIIDGTGTGSQTSADGTKVFQYVLQQGPRYGVVEIIVSIDEIGSNDGPNPGFFNPPVSPSLIASYGLPTGSGAPRLLLASSRTYCEQNTVSTMDPATDTLTQTTTRKWYPSAVRISSSNDFGRTWQPGADVEALAVDGTPLADGTHGIDTMVQTFRFESGFWVSGETTWPVIWPYKFARAVTLQVLPDGSIFVNGIIGLSPETNGDVDPDRDWQWKTARITADSTGSSGWRDCTTINNQVVDGVSFRGDAPVWQSRGTYQGSRGGGGQSAGPGWLHAATGGNGLESHDGDNWSGPVGSGIVPQTGSLSFRFGASTDGFSSSLDDYASAPISVAGLPIGSVPMTPLDGNTFRAVRTLSSKFIQVWTSRGPATAPDWQSITLGIKTFDERALAIGWCTPTGYALMVPTASDVLQCYTVDDETSAVATVWSSSNGKTWRNGAPS